MRRRLPIGTQTFSIIRRGGYVYADKTDLAYSLADDYRMVFLSRPRRFGKSLLVSTLEAYFTGHRELFEGLKIEALEKNWKTHPVLRLDFSQNDYGTRGNLEFVLDGFLRKNETLLGIEASDNDFAGRFENLIERLHVRTGDQVVVLVDEYDKPILDALGENHEEDNRKLVRGFYGVLKSSDEHLRFVFLTGITKVSHVNIFSGLNQLKDISLSDKYSAICGFTEDDVVGIFGPEIEALASRNGMSFGDSLQRLRQMYDGYRFSGNGKGVYNPFCLLCAFDELKFGSYWMASGTPSVLVQRLQDRVVDANRLIQEGREVGEMFFADYDSSSSDIAPLLYQSGYLTIVGYDAASETYRLGFPNREVSEGLMKYLLPKYLAAVSVDSDTAIEHLRRALLDGDAAKVAAIVSSCVSSIPTMTRESCENYYESIVHVLFRTTGFEVVSQMQSSAGRADIVLHTPGSVWIFELKMDGRSGDVAGLCDAALRQIVEKGYAKPYEASGKPIRKVALVFSSAKLGLVGWKEEVE